MSLASHRNAIFTNQNLEYCSVHCAMCTIGNLFPMSFILLKLFGFEHWTFFYEFSVFFLLNMNSPSSKFKLRLNVISGASVLFVWKKNGRNACWKNNRRNSISNNKRYVLCWYELPVPLQLTINIAHSFVHEFGIPIVVQQKKTNRI